MPGILSPVSRLQDMTRMKVLQARVADLEELLRSCKCKGEEQRCRVEQFIAEGIVL